MFRLFFRFAYYWHRNAALVYPNEARKALFLLTSTLLLVSGAAKASDPNPLGEDADGSSVMALSFDQLLDVNVDKVYGASKFEQPITRAPASVSIITQDDIKKYGYRTLGDVLRSVRGFYVTYDRSYNFVGVRGIDRPGDFGGRLLINVDGHRLNEPVYDSAFTDTEFLLDLDLVDRVEVIRGPGSSLYGDNAFFGVVNVITRTGKDVKGGEVSGAAGSLDTYSGRVSVGNRFTNGVELLASVSYLNSDGHDALYFPEYSSINNGYAEHLDGTETWSTFASISYSDFKLQGGYMDRRKHAPTAQYAPYSVFNDPRFVNEDERAYGELSYQHEFACDWLVQARAYYDVYNFSGTYPLNNNAPYPGPTVINRDVNHAQWAGVEASVSKTFFESQRVTLGGEYRDDFSIEVKNYDVNPPALYQDSQRSPSAFGFYAQDEISLLTNLTVNVGVRYDHYSTFGETWNPRGAVIYSPWQEGTWKFIYGQAFRAPNAFELYYLTPTFKPNPALGPETIHSYEVVYEQGLPANLRSTVSLFWNEIEGLISQTEDPYGVNFFDNLENVRVRGIETELEGRWKGGLRARVSYAYTEARDRVTDEILDNSPRHLGKANFTAPLWRDKIFAGIELQAMGGRTTEAGDELDPYCVVNVTLYTRELVKNLEFSASIYNLFDTNYRDPMSSDYKQDSIREDGRGFRFKLNYRF